MLIDVFYLISYAFILFVLFPVVMGSWTDSEAEILETQIADKRALKRGVAMYILSLVVVVPLWRVAH